MADGKGVTKMNNLFVPYDSPIDVIFNKTVDNIMAAFNKSIDDGVVTAVVKAGFNVDKDKLVEALTQDRKRYEKAYRKGYEQRDADIIRCKDCKWFHCGTCINDRFYDQEVNDDWYCADSERKDGDGE